MTIGCNIWMICLELNWFFTIRVECCNFLLRDATDRSKNSSDQKRLYFTVNLYPLSFFKKNPFNYKYERHNVVEKGILRNKKVIQLGTQNWIEKNITILSKLKKYVFWGHPVGCRKYYVLAIYANSFHCFLIDHLHSYG